MAELRTRKRGKTWSYSFDAKTLDGKRKIVEKGGFATKKEAIDAGTKAYASYKNGNIGIVSEKISTQDFLEKWLKVKETEVRASTFVSYTTCQKRIVPIIGNVPVQELRPRNIDGMMILLAQRKLSAGALSLTLGLLKNALDYAVYPCELIPSNPARYIKVPKSAPREVIKRYVIGNEKLQELLAAYPFGHPCHMPIMLAYHTGMRLGEVLGLCWDVVDLKQGKISVVRQLSYISGRGYCFSDPKTKTSKREILLDGQIIALLRKWKTAQAQNELSQGGAYFRTYEGSDGYIWHFSKGQDLPAEYTPLSLVCTKINGAYVSRETVFDALKKHGVNFHSLRHTHATLLIEAGAIPKDVATRLGHTDATITQNIYTHDTEEMQKSTVAIFEKIVSGK